MKDNSRYLILTSPFDTATAEKLSELDKLCVGADGGH